MKISYQLCPSERIDHLIQFIDTHWKKNHILTQHRALLDWQYKNKQGGYNFVLATDEFEDVQGIFGYIPTSQFSNSLPKNDDVWLAIWKVREDCNIPGLGMSMLSYAKKLLEVKTFCALGMSDIVKPIYKALGYTLGALDHFVAFSISKSNYEFVSPVVQPKALHVNTNMTKRELDRSGLESLTEENQKKLFCTFPRKNVEYLINRYVLHPIYSYKIFAIYKHHNDLKTVVVIRTIDVDNAKIARIVDTFGDSFLNCEYNKCIYSLLDEMDCEYIDCMAHGLDMQDIEHSCFSNIKDTEGLIIPNYFEPLVRSNINLEFAYQTQIQCDFSIFKGDSDQDRPNRL